MPHSPVNGRALVKAQYPELKGAGKDLQPFCASVLHCLKKRQAGPWEIGIGEELLGRRVAIEDSKLIPPGLALSGRCDAARGARYAAG